MGVVVKQPGGIPCGDLGPSGKLLTCPAHCYECGTGDTQCCPNEWLIDANPGRVVAALVQTEGKESLVECPVNGGRPFPNTGDCPAQCYDCGSMMCCLREEPVQQQAPARANSPPRQQEKAAVRKVVVKQPGDIPCGDLGPSGKLLTCPAHCYECGTGDTQCCPNEWLIDANPGRVVAALVQTESKESLVECPVNGGRPFPNT